ncbi:helix-turn-helix transcriptional regulator [Phytomonospora endophytica]|uniref:Transcriptional regulator with XRE-family HTH domain n=1 Tax=Phytomonospora endophytica TaxID=714109 RepID=A0A841G404_9ACTN|nr:helix-turn-helix transcriptional regulator [Phytomonospora endophytica]MBB6039439.1 transcriptional regulator with XRE-family HTH domain [Phytomonospora endophytica]GIG70166.1 transcriptional regulator [Phytomonospora endophytica]
MQRAELAEYLRARRAKLKPSAVGLPEGGRRRTPGLRRQEVAQLAGMSIEYYIRLEQARGPRPSRQILSALSRALMLNIDERTHLFHLAGETPAPQSLLRRDVPPSILHLIEGLTDVPAYVLDAKYDILAWNDLAVAFIGDLSAHPEHDRNVLRWIFREPVPELFTDRQHLAFARSSIADLRAALGRYPDDPSIGAFVEELLRASPEFGQIWAEHEVEVRRDLSKTIDHPEHGTMHITCQVLLIPDRDQRLVLYVTAPGSPSYATMQRIRAERALAADALTRSRYTPNT